VTALQSSEVILHPLSEETLYVKSGKKPQPKRSMKKTAFARPANQVVRSKNLNPSSVVTALRLSEVILHPLSEETRSVRNVKKLQTMRKSFASPANQAVRPKIQNPSSEVTAHQSSEGILPPLSEETQSVKNVKKHLWKRKLKRKSFVKPANQAVRPKIQIPSSEVTALQSSEVILHPLSEGTL
jgi:hypothetical protein